MKLLIAIIILLMIVLVVENIWFLKKREKRKKHRIETKNELQAAYDELAENQNRLEEFACEQEAQIEEITELNNQLEREHAELQNQYTFAETISKKITDAFVADIHQKMSTSIKINGAILDPRLRKSRPYAEGWNFYLDKYVVEEDRETLLKEVDLSNVIKVLESKEEHVCRYRYHLGDDVYFYQVSFSYLGDKEDGFIIFGFRSIDDIVREERAHRKELEELNSELSEKLDIISNAGYGIWKINMKSDGNHTMEANDTLQDIFGVKEMDLSPTELYRFYHDRLVDDVTEIESQDYASMEEGIINTRVLEWNHPTRGIVYLSAGGTSYVEPNGETFISGYCGDITKQRFEIMELNETLEAALHQTEAANKAKTDFLFSMSHDIRTPMNAIIGYANLLESHLDDREKCKDYVTKIRRSSDFLLDLINNVLEMARIESGNMIPSDTTVCVSELLEKICSVFEDEMAQKNIAFKKNVEIKNSYVFCDPLMIQKIYLNILSNALKYTPEGGTIAVSLREVESEREDYVTYEIQFVDTGIGMSKEFLPHIFDEFTREKTSTENKIQGTGLGMPIVKKLVDLMGGSITVESELGRGTTFILQLSHKLSNADAMVIDEAISADNYDFSGKRILLAEDNDLNAEIITEILHETGVTLDRAVDGAICVEMLEKAEPGYYHLVLMDVQMPNMNGYEATRKIREMDNIERSTIPIFAMTANAFEEDKQNALESGMNGHLAKPINLKKLFHALSGALGE